MAFRGRVAEETYRSQLQKHFRKLKRIGAATVEINMEVAPH